MSAAEPRTETLTIVAPCDWINANQRLHWTKRNYLTQTWKTAAWTKARSQRVAPFAAVVDIAVVIHKQRNGRWDPHNLMPTSKALIDGLVKAGVLVDDDRKHLRRVSIEAGEVKARNAVTLTIAEVAPEQVAS
jgi:hypothetical protein